MLNTNFVIPYFMKLNKLFTKTLFVSLLAMATLFVACKDDDKEPENVDTNPIVGTWQLNGLKTTAGADLPQLNTLLTLAPCLFDLKFEFMANNKVTAKDCVPATALMASFLPITAETTWKVENGTLTLTNGANVKTFPITQADKEMKITVSIDLTGTGTTSTTGVMVFNKL
jgi:hypothetical protein